MTKPASPTAIPLSQLLELLRWLLPLVLILLSLLSNSPNSPRLFDAGLCLLTGVSCSYSQQ